jgi:hypothetical protein
MYYVPVNDSVYVFADYSASIVDELVIDEVLNGKTVTILESSHCELINDVYNNGVNVKATYVNDSTCFIVLKIN